jgi:predicted MFS family arabinose efflux permease
VLAVCVSLTFQILLPVVPVMVERQGPHGIAGAATAALFLGAVAGELSSAWLMTIVRSRRLMVTGQLVTALASLVYTIPNASTGAMIGAAAARGAGMGVAIVIATALISELASPARRGASIGAFGLAMSLPGIFVPSIGVYLLAAGHPEIDAWIGFAASLVGMLAALRIPNRPRHVSEGATNLLDAIRRPGIGILFAGYVLISCSFGGGLTFVPIALPLGGLGSAATYLLVAGGTRALGRWLSGVTVDRTGARGVLVGGTLLSLVGLVALAVHANPAFVIFAGLCYGAGYGSIQTAAYVGMLERGTARDSGAISALWNSGIDLGSSLGGTIVGLTAARVGYAAAAWVLPAAVLMALPLFLLGGRKVPVQTEVAATEQQALEQSVP